MSVIVILLLPLAAALLVCIPFGKRWVPGVTVVFCLADLILVGRVAHQLVSWCPPPRNFWSRPGPNGWPSTA